MSENGHIPNTKVADLRPNSSGVSLTVKVLDSKVVVTRPRGNRGDALRIAECLVGDSTGIVLFSARNEQVDKAQPGSVIILQNADVDMYRGSMRLIVDKKGSVEQSVDQSIKPKTDFNMSLVEFEFVPIDAA